MNERKICFIICTNREQLYNECLFYLGRLAMPQGYQVELLPIYNAKSLASGYNTAMAATDAKYKVYLHQDVCILNPNFLNDLLTIFCSEPMIGLVGMVGTPRMPDDAIPWNAQRVGNVYAHDRDNVDFNGYAYRIEDGLIGVECVDGFLMATGVDVTWREDIFDGWDYSDVAQAYELRRRGYRVVVPEQKKPWCAHDYGIHNLWRYDRYRKIFMEEYLKKS